jgi:hypothetical protein
MMNEFNINGESYLTIQEASKFLDEQYQTTYKKLDKFKVLKIGNLLLVDKESLKEYREWKNKYLKNEA